MDSLIRGLHHVTATVNKAQPDLDFYVALLGQRLVKKTINFDNPGVFHFYYGNESGDPGTIMTTFPYGSQGVRPGANGAGQIETTSFSVPEGALDFWRQRLLSARVAFAEAPTPFGEDAIVCDDPSGLHVRLIATSGDHRAPWITREIGAAHAIRGVHSVAMPVRHPRLTIDLLTSLMDFSLVGEEAGIKRFSVGSESAAVPGAVVEVLDASDADQGRNGLGTVHHVAFAVADEAEQHRMRAALLSLGLSVTDVMDRQYFKSIYFREPNGVLFEIATAGPGFLIDESSSDLGRALKLPPWEESRRGLIESHLPKVEH